MLRLQMASREQPVQPSVWDRLFICLGSRGLPAEQLILVVDATAEAANQVSYGEGHRGSGVRALLYGCTQEVVGLAGGFADGVGRGRRRVLRLSVDILQSTFRLLCLALELGFHVAGCASESLFHLAAKILGVAGQAIFVHGRIPSAIRKFNGRGRRRFPVRQQKWQRTIWAWRLGGGALRRSRKLAAARPQTRNGCDDRRQQEKTRERYGRGQRTVPFGQPDECDQQDKAGGEHAEYNGKQRPNEKAGAQADLSLRL